MSIRLSVCPWECCGSQTKEITYLRFTSYMNIFSLKTFSQMTSCDSRLRRRYARWTPPWTPLNPFSSVSNHNPLPNPGIMVPNLGVNFNCCLKINFILFFYREMFSEFNRIKCLYYTLYISFTRRYLFINVIFDLLNSANFSL